MHTVELLEEALRHATAAGFSVRQDWLAGAAAGACELKGRRYLFLDLGMSPAEQLELVLEALRYFAEPLPNAPSPQLQSLLVRRQAA